MHRMSWKVFKIIYKREDSLNGNNQTYNGVKLKNKYFLNNYSSNINLISGTINKNSDTFEKNIRNSNIDTKRRIKKIEFEDLFLI